jgi:hypothetical protein
MVRTVATTVEVDAHGIPEDQTANYLDLETDEADLEAEQDVNTTTGEVRELTPVA